MVDLLVSGEWIHDSGSFDVIEAVRSYANLVGMPDVSDVRLRMTLGVHFATEAAAGHQRSSVQIETILAQKSTRAAA